MLVNLKVIPYLFLFTMQRPPNEATKMTVAATAADPVIPLFPEPPTCLVIQTELCREETLHHWLRKNIRNRHRKTVFNYFSQVSLIDSHNPMYSVIWNVEVR